MKTDNVSLTQKRADTVLYIALCATIALLTCFTAGLPVTEFIGSLAVLAMFTLYFTMAAGTFAEQHPEKRAVIFCAADSVSLALKIAFTALCAINGGVMIHAAALTVDMIFSRFCALRAVK